ncbi:Uncharacterised protein [Mycobacteroides abscessus subsp. abscessus]|nr:Uncharacterised protein [Mycobacteroides abscessus subsp. abscessus]
MDSSVSMANGTDAAEVLPVCSMSLAMTASGRRCRFLASNSLIRVLA